MPQVELITIPKSEFDEMANLILDLFAQGTLLDDEHYNHMCMSSYENAQRWLIKYGLVKPEQCIYQD